MTTFAEAAEQVRPLDQAAMSAADARQPTLAKPPGSLGRLEAVARRLAGIAGRCPAPIPTAPAVAVFAGDHGVLDAGVTPWPQAITAAMVQNFVGGGAGINAIARHLGIAVHVVDVGIAGPPSTAAEVQDRRVRSGTRNLAVEAAMTADEVTRALDVGSAVAGDLVAAGHDLLLTGEMGIGNTTPTACLIGALTGTAAEVVTGRGTGIDDEHLERKTAVVADAMRRAEALEPRAVVAEVGGLEITALAGFIVGGVAAGVPVLVDGVICCAAALVAERLVPGVSERCLFSHRSAEHAAVIAMEALEVEPLLDLGLRLGEGTGAALAVPIVQAAAATLAEIDLLDDLMP
ncbi:MAG: nicotinate-nucleotide--dimethylbenzimidazole phosphoribosyltransferase [Actinomycetota bacterium]